MSDIDNYFGEIDTNRIRRARELSDIQTRLASPLKKSPYAIYSKAVIVLSYSHWEGFFNDCINTYINSLIHLDRKVVDISWSMMIGLLQPSLNQLRDRHHSRKAQKHFVNSLKNILKSSFDDFDVNTVNSRSNLDFGKLRDNFQILDFEVSKFESHRLKIDKELVGWRHSIAHGNNPDLTEVDLKEHVTFTQNLLLNLSDSFQDKMSDVFFKQN